MTALRRFSIIALVATAMLLPRGVAASSAACCVVKSSFTKNTMGCLPRQIPDSELAKVKANPSSFSSTYCAMTIPSLSFTATLALGACDAQPAATKCAAPPEQNKTFLEYKTQWNTGGFCAYKANGSTAYDACTEVTGSVCPGAFNYGAGELYSGPKNGGFCPAANPADFSDALAAGNNAVPGKEVVSDTMDGCVYYTGSKYTDEGVVSCAEPEMVQGKKMCAVAPAGQNLQPTPQHPTEIKACQLSQHCCLVYQDNNSDKVAQTSEVLQCSPLNVGCTSEVYSKDASVVTGNKDDAGTAYDKILYRTESVQKVCGQVNACAGKSIGTDQALKQLLTNAGAASASMSKLTPEQKAELEKVTNEKGPTWTQALCEAETNNVWSPPDPSITSGPYCLTNPDKAKVDLNIPIGGLSIASLATYIPNLFNYGLGILATMTVLAIIFAGFQWATAAGNASAVGNAKEIMMGAFAALFVALGSYTLLQTISPNLLEFRLPPIAAILPVEFYGKGDEFICCDQKGVCLQVQAQGPNMFVTLSDGSKIGLDSNFDAKTCLPMTAQGEYCREQGPIGDECRKVGGTCTVGHEDSGAEILTNDKSQQGWCSVIYNNYIGGALKGFKDLGSTITLGISDAIATKIGTKIKSGPDLTPGTGELGRCYKNIDKRVAGQYCRANAECASGTCVRLQDTASCFSDRELGKCSDGNKGDICNPLGHTLVGGKNAYKQQTVCKQGLTCNFVRENVAGAFADPNSIPGDYYECGDGTLNSACGTVVSACYGKELPAGDDNDCDEQSTLLGNAICHYEQQRAHVELRLTTAGLLSGTTKVAWAVQIAGQGAQMLSSGGLGKIAAAKSQALLGIAGGLTLANGVSQEELKREIAELEAYAYAAAFTDPNAQNCKLDEGAASISLCKGGLTCQKVQGNGGLRCVPGNNSAEGSICSYIGAEAHEYSGLTNSVSNGDNCDEANGLRCSVARVEDSDGWHGVCTKATWGSPCLVNPASGNGTWSYDARDCNNIKPDSDLGEDKVSGYTLGEGHPVCYKAPGSTGPFGACGYVRNLDETLDNKVYISSEKAVLFTTENTAQIISDNVVRDIGQPCALPSVPKEKWFKAGGKFFYPDFVCRTGLRSPAFRTQLIAEGLAMQAPMLPSSVFLTDGAAWEGMCVMDTENVTQGRCGVYVGNSKTKKDFLWAPFDPTIHAKYFSW